MDAEKSQPRAVETPEKEVVTGRYPILDKIYWTPPWCRWDVANPAPLTIWLNILFACAGGFTSANLYYSHPILNVLANDFHTTQAGVSNIPTLAQAGDATGLLLILPLADFFPRRRFALTLISCSALFWIGLCITKSLTVFSALTYLSALFSGATQIMLPLVAELSPPEKRAFNISIVAAGPSMAILLARILSGIVAQYTSWRNVYWLALGFQGSTLLALFLRMPDYPAVNPISFRKLVKTYPKILWSIVTLYPRHAILVQCGLVAFCTFFVVSSYWTTLTFLLAGAPYHYGSLVVGLFGLIGASTMVLGPVYGKYIVQPLRLPSYSVLIGNSVSMVGTVIGTYVGTHSIAGPVIQALFLDAGLMISQVANRMQIHHCEPKGRNRVNTAFVSMLYIGQLTGTKAGNDVYSKYGGWIASGSLNVAILALAYVVVLARGPYEKRWVGWTGGWRFRPEQDLADADNTVVDTQKPTSIAMTEKEMEDATLTHTPARASLDTVPPQTLTEAVMELEGWKNTTPQHVHEEK